MKKSLILLLTISIFFSSILIPINKAGAVVVPLTRIALGSTAEKIVLGAAERAGVKMGTRGAQQDLINGLNKRAVHDRDPDAINFINKVNSMKPVREKGAFEKYVFDPLAFITGADILIDIGKSLFGGSKDKPVDVFDENGKDNVSIPGLSCKMYIQNLNEYSGDDRLKKGTGIFDIFIGDKGMDGYGKWPFGIKGESTCAIDKVYKSEYGNDYVKWHADDVYYDGDYPHKPSRVDYDTRIYSNDTYPSYGLKAQADINISSNSTITTNNYIDNRIDDRDVTNMPKHIEVNVDKTWIDNDTGISGKPYTIDVDYPNIIIEDKDDGQTDKDKGWNIIVNVDVDYPDRIEDDVPDGEIDIPKDDDIEDGRDYYGDLTPVDDPIAVPKNFFMVMQDMGRKVSDMYSGVVHFFEVSVDGMKSLTSGMTGFVRFLDEFFDWLPDEYTALLGVGFTLGVVSFFLRR